MPTTKLNLDLDSGLLARVRAVAEKRDQSLNDLVIALLTDLVKEDRRRWAKQQLYKPFVERPTVSLGATGQPPQDASDDSEE